MSSKSTWRGRAWRVHHETLYTRIDVPCDAPAAGLSQLSSAVAAGRLAVEGREAELREEINAALRKMRAYARDMEVGGGGSAGMCSWQILFNSSRRC